MNPAQDSITRYFERSPGILNGALCVRGTRISVDFVKDLLWAGWTEREILANYPRLSPVTIEACRNYSPE